MKYIYKIIIFCFFITNSFAQSVTEVDVSTYNQGDNSNKYFKDINNNYANFTGTWEKTTGNITFRVNLWKDTMVSRSMSDQLNCYMDIIRGSYQIIQDAGTINEVILHNSVKNTPNGVWESVIVMRAGSSVSAFGWIDDNCATNTVRLDGRLWIKITNPSNSPSVAHWTVTRKGINFEGINFTVPTDIILTKVN